MKVKSQSVSHSVVSSSFCDPLDCSLPGSSVHGILQARILEWVAISFLKEGFKSRLSGYEIPFFPRHHRNLPPNDDTGIQSANYMKDSQ